jgi:ParB/RepB/Spo0J family partition protein
MTDAASQPLPDGDNKVVAFPTHRNVAPEEYALLPITSLTIGDDFRLDDDLEDLNELAQSIREHGILLPLLVRPKGDSWEVSAGRRRLAASRIAGLERVPCRIRMMTQDEANDAALAENLHRRNLSPIEIGLAYDRLRKKGLTQTAIAKRVGRSEWHVSVLLRLLELPSNIRTKIHTGQISYATAYRTWKRAKTGKRQGGSSETPLTSPRNDAAQASHWRRRHDRLITALHAWDQAIPETLPDYRDMIRRILKLDITPFEPESKSHDA